MNNVLEEVLASADRAVTALQARAGGRLDWSVASIEAVVKQRLVAAGLVVA